MRDIYFSGDCSDVYSQDSDNCDGGCGVCFNGNGRDVEKFMSSLTSLCC